MSYKVKRERIYIYKQNKNKQKWKSPDTILWDKEPLNIPLSFFFVAHPLLGTGLLLRVVYFPSELSLEKTKFSLANGYQLEIASGLGMGTFVPFSFQFLDSNCCKPVYTLDILPHFLWGFDLFDLEGHEFLMSSNSANFYTLSISFSQSSLSSEEKD